MILVLIFLVFAGLMIARILPALLSVPLMALALALGAGVDVHGLGPILATGVVKLAPYYTTVIFGALLGRVVLSTGIAETVVNYAAEFGGDKPLALALVLCAAVAVLFTSQTGLGAIIMIGSIVLPVMLTVGVPRTTAATLFLLSFALGYVLNIAQWKFYRDVFGVDQPALQTYVYVLFAIDALILIVYAVVRARTTRDYATFAIAADAPRKRVSPWALLTPILPLILFVVLHVDALAAFALSALYGAIAANPRALVQTLVSSWIRGVEDVAPAIILMMGIGMLLVAANTPEVAQALAPVVSAIAPRTPLAYVVLFGLLSPLALYRGPLNPFGVGIGVYAVLATLHVLPPVALVAAVMAVVQVQNVCDPTNTQNVWVANFTGVGVEKITRLTLPFQVGVAVLATLAVVFFGGALFGTPVFVTAAPAAAAELNPGLYAPAAAMRTIAVGSDGTPEGRRAAHAIVESIARGWTGYRAFAREIDPSATDCAQKDYAAFVHVAVTAQGTERDVALELADCAGWNVDQWHEAGAGDVRALALADLFRIRVWQREHPAESELLFARGLAYDPAAAKPTYFYSLFKTTDGYMRTIARPGGPAYAAGMRSNEIVDKIDNRFWWEYGTYQSQLRAYDGKPHSFDVQRGHGTTHIELGEPFRL